jgi:hypothetical protein
MEVASKWGTTIRPAFENIANSLAIIYINCQDRAPQLNTFLSDFNQVTSKEMLQYYFKIM